MHPKQKFRRFAGGGAVLILAAALSLSAHSATGASSADVLRDNKKLVTDLFAVINHGTNSDLAILDTIVAEDYIQHNPRAEQGRAGLRKFLAYLISQPTRELRPEDSISVTLVAEGDMVVRQEMRTNGMLVDIFRVEGGKLKEHWDAFRFAPGARPIPGF